MMCGLYTASAHFLSDAYALVTFDILVVPLNFVLYFRDARAQPARGHFLGVGF